MEEGALYWIVRLFTSDTCAREITSFNSSIGISLLRYFLTLLLSSINLFIISKESSLSIFLKKDMCGYFAQILHWNKDDTFLLDEPRW